MPKASVAKTASAPKIFLIGLSIIIVLGLVFAHANVHTAQRMTIGSRSYNVETVNTSVARNLGLSGRSVLAANTAMLFVFDETGRPCFWMKDMHFPIDIAWLGESRNVVYLEQNVSQSSYPKEFCPDSLAKYVVEVNAGELAKNKVVFGDILDF